MAIRVSCSGGVYVQDTSQTLPEGITYINLKWFIFKSLLKLIWLGYANVYWLWPLFCILHRSVGKVFCTMDGNGCIVNIHPSSSVIVFLGSLQKLWLIKHSSHQRYTKTLILLSSFFLVFSPSCLSRKLSWTGSSFMMLWWPHGCTSGLCVLFIMSGWRIYYLSSMRWTFMNWAAWQEKKWLMRRW